MDAQRVISLIFFLCQAIAGTGGENLRWFPPYSSEPEGKPPESSPLEPIFLFFEALEMMVDFLPSGITKVHPKASKVEYSGELGSQNDPKMEPKREPRQQRPILTKHAQALTDCMSTPPLGAPFSFIFLDLTNVTNKST